VSAARYVGRRRGRAFRTTIPPVNGKIAKKSADSVREEGSPDDMFTRIKMSIGVDGIIISRRQSTSAEREYFIRRNARVQIRNQ